MRKIKNILKKLYKDLMLFLSKNHEIKKFKDKRRRKIYKSVKLTKSQKDQVNFYFKKHYGKKVPLTWHRHYTAFTGKFDYRYFPELLYIPLLDRSISNRDYQKAMSDKNNLFFFTNKFENIEIPQTFLSKINGIYRNGELNTISFEQAIKKIGNIGDCFLKPSIETNSGQGCFKLNIINEIDTISGKSIIDILKTQGNNFLIQELIHPHDSIGIFNASSANTFRVITYILKNGTIKNSPTTFRMGRNNSYLDNAHAGGIFIHVDDEGHLSPVAFSEFNDKFYEHPDSKIKFDGYKIDELPEILDVAKKMHALTPQIRIMHWDITINDKGKIMLLEANTMCGSIWLPQMSSGAGPFGDDIWELLEEIRR